tara:strand:+ start:334 stop:786 length:453 start_codon:yes stop_codon:yes gene_type:complete
MKLFFFLAFLLLLTSCFGYKPIFSSSNINYNIKDVKNITQDKVSNYIARKLKSYKSDDKKNDIFIEISSTNKERVLSKDTKGDPIIFEMNIIVDVKLTLEGQNTKNFQFKENFSYNNRSNKFDLKLYKDNLQKNISEKITKNIILKIRSL